MLNRGVAQARQSLKMFALNSSMIVVYLQNLGYI